VRALAQAVLLELGPVRAERIRLDDVAADFVVAAVHARDDVGPEEVERLVAALAAAEIFDLEVLTLERGAHRAVEDEDAALQPGEKRF